MKQLAIAMVAALVLASCSTIQNIETGLSLATASITNPVTPTRLNQLESGITIAAAGLEGWKKSCTQGLIPVACKQQIEAVQVYTKQIPPYLAQLRSFVKSNDQVNAIVVFNNITSLLSAVKSGATSNGINLGG